MANSIQGSNGYNAEKMNGFLAEIDEADDELLTLQGEYRNACKGPRGKIKLAMTSAKEEGLNMTAFREVVAKHRAERASERRLEQFEADDRDAYENMVEALGQLSDTPLGAAALAKKKAPRGEQSLDRLA